MSGDQQKRVWDAAYGAAFASFAIASVRDGKDVDFVDMSRASRKIATEAVNQLRRS